MSGESGAGAEAETIEPTAEDLASKRGWKPLDDYTGPKEKWVDAQEFLRRGEDEPALLKKNLKTLEAKIAQQDKTLADFAKHHSQVEQRAYERAIKDLENRQAQAVADGNVGAVQAITKEITDLATTAKTAPKIGQPSGDPVADFRERNGWYGVDPDKTAWAKGMSQQLADQGLDPEAQLVEIEKRARKLYPDAYGNTRRDDPSPVEGGASQGARTHARSYNDLPGDAKAACDRFVKSIPGYTREKYVKDYFAQA